MALLPNCKIAKSYPSQNHSFIFYPFIIISRYFDPASFWSQVCLSWDSSYIDGRLKLSTVLSPRSSAEIQAYARSTTSSRAASHPCTLQALCCLASLVTPELILLEAAQIILGSSHLKAVLTYARGTASFRAASYPCFAQAPWFLECLYQIGTGMLDFAELLWNS